ncbi:hypothetical protein IAU60_004535 [Kwoniella sp. DSM 27419]
MFDPAYEEEIMQQAVMAEVLPDAEMWAKWEKTEAPLRQGRGWYPRLDRHFLELLVISEINALSKPLSAPQAGTNQSDKIHRHASRVRRVACERIGAERLNAYCDRVKEAFEAYMMGGWAQHRLVEEHCAVLQTQVAEGEVGEGLAGMNGERKRQAEDSAEIDDMLVEQSTSCEHKVPGGPPERGRTLRREGSQGRSTTTVEQHDSGVQARSPPRDMGNRATEGGPRDATMFEHHDGPSATEEDPFADPLSDTTTHSGLQAKVDLDMDEDMDMDLILGPDFRPLTSDQHPGWSDAICLKPPVSLRSFTD